jgi:two-component system sensor histidine kinase MprB
LQRKDGSAFDTEWIMAPVSDANGRWVGCVDLVRDISQEKALQAQKDRFIAHASHELRTPLSNIKTRLYLLRNQPDRLSEHVEVLDAVTDEMGDLVKHLLDLSNFQRSMIQLQRGATSLDHILRDALSIQQARAQKKHIALEAVLPDGPFNILADSQWLTQAVSNVIANAINRTPSGEHVRARLTAESPAWIITQVEDAGPSIVPNLLPQVFDPFFRASEGHIEGSGLALTIAKTVIELHGGTITAQNAPERGLVTTIRLPAGEVPGS